MPPRFRTIIRTKRAGNRRIFRRTYRRKNYKPKENRKKVSRNAQVV